MKRRSLSLKLTVCGIIFFLLAVYPGHAPCEQPKIRDYWPTDGWRSSPPAAQGMNIAKLMIADGFVRDRLPDAYSLLVVRNGYLVFEQYYSLGNPDRFAVVHSVTKSVTAALIGVGLQKGCLKTVDEKIAGYFSDCFRNEADAGKTAISIEHLLTMSAGFKWDDWGPELYDFVWSADPACFAIARPLEDPPGAVFNYNSSLSHLLSIILARATGMTLFEFADQHLFKPLGIRHRAWQSDIQGFYYGGFGLALSARDLAKIGFLYLNNGYWDGSSIVPEAWVKASTRRQIRANPHPIYGRFDYGYHWWVKDVDGFSSYRAWGRRGQYIVVIPQLDLVIAVTSDPGQPHPPTAIHYNPLFDLVAAAVERERPPDRPLVAVDLPLDVRTFLAEYNQARHNKDLKKMSAYISDHFLYSGVPKKMAVRFLGAVMDYTAEADIIVTRFEPQGELADVDVWLKDKYYQYPFMTGSRIVRENGKWKWYGNQLQR